MHFFLMSIRRLRSLISKTAKWIRDDGLDPFLSIAAFDKCHCEEPKGRRGSLQHPHALGPIRCITWLFTSKVDNGLIAKIFFSLCLCVSVVSFFFAS